MLAEVGKDVRNKILEQFDRTEEALSDDILALKEWLKTQPHIPETPCDHVLSSFLKVSKYSIEAAKKKIDVYYTIRPGLPKMLNLTTINPNNKLIKDHSDVCYCLLMPELTDDGDRIVLGGINSDNADLFDAHLTFARFFNFCELRLLKDFCFRTICVVDLRNFNVNHMTKCSPALMKKAVVVFRKTFTTSMRALHLINCSSVVEQFAKILKTVFPEAADELFVHTTLDTLYEHIDRKMLPSDYGGQQKSVKELRDILKMAMAESKGYFDRLDTLKVNEALRPDKLIDDEILGFHGNFKQLNVD